MVGEPLLRHGPGVWLAGLVIGLLLVPSDTFRLGAQQQQQPQTFRSGVEVVRLDINVLDPERKPIRGMRREDFIVLVDGVVQPLVDAAEVDYTVPRAVRASAPSVPAGYVSNYEPEHRRAFIIVLDDAMTVANTFQVQYTIRAARAFVEGLQPDDLVAVVYSERSVHNQELTADRDLVLKAIDQFRPAFAGHARGLGIRIPNVLPNTASARTVRAAVERLQEVPHVRGAVLLISPGLQSQPDSEEAIQENDGGRIRTADIIHGAELSAIGQAAYGRVPIYAVSNAGLGGRSSPPPVLGITSMTRTEYLRMLADESGGHAVYDTNDHRAGIEQILLENNHHYLLGYQPTYPVQDGRYRRLEVRVARTGAAVFPSGRVFQTPRPARHTIEPSPRTAIGGILPVPDIPLAVRATPGKASSRRGPVAVAIDLTIGPVAGPAGHADLECAAFDAGNLSQAASTTGVAALPGGADVITTQLEMTVRPGRYNLRCGLHAPALGKSASVYANLTVPAR
jgi:VWFA-related protein